MTGPRFELRYFLLAVLIALVLWGMAHGSSSIERGFDIPVVIHDLPDRLVVTDLSADVVNIRVLGSRAALRDIDPVADRVRARGRGRAARASRSSRSTSPRSRAGSRATCAS